MTALYCVILAGGSKNGLWPLSTETLYKQKFNFNSACTLFQQTFLNVASLIDDKNIITTTNVKYNSIIKEQLKTIQEKFCRKTEYKVLSEPIFRNTAPAVSLAVQYIKDELSFFSSSAVILVVPSDMFIMNREEFFSYIEKGVKLANEGYIVTFGSETSDINEKFGYIKARKLTQISNVEESALKVSKFVEKPVSKEIKDDLKGRIYVNSGMYMFSIETYLTELKKCAPDIYKHISDKVVKNTTPSISLTDYEKIPNISIDYAIMEKSKKLALVPLNSKWIDICSWNALYDISDKDENGNCFYGKTADIDSKNSIVYSTSKLIATLGLKNTIVAETEDAVMVCGRDNTEGIKKISKKLNAKNSSEKEIHKTEYRPWGYYNVLESGNGFLTKCITVNPNAKLSIQLHHHRSEHWIVLEGEATVIKGKETVKLSSGESIDIAIEEIHSLQNFGKEQLKVLEIQQGDILDENDIERLEDIYGRV